MEGLSIGVDVAAHYALDPARVGTIARDLPANVAADVVAPAGEARDPLRGHRPTRSWELLNGQTLATERAADAPTSLKAFARFQAPGWRRMTVSLR